MQTILGLFIALAVHVANQQEFDALQTRIDSLLHRGEQRIEVLLEPGIYFFREGHLGLSDYDVPDVEVRIAGRDVTLVAGDNGRGYHWENGYVDLESLRPVDVRNPVRQAGFWPVPCLFQRDLYKIPCQDPNLEKAEATGVRVILSQWFFGAVYDVEKIQNGWLYFRKTERGRTRMWSELRFGRCRPRYILCFPPKRTDLHTCTESAFLQVKDCHLKSFSLEGITFLGNGAGNPLLSVTHVQADTVRVSDCRFEGLRSQGIEVKGTDHFILTNSLFRDCFLGAVHLSADTRDAQVQGNRFLDNGIQMTNAPIVLCQGEDFVIRDNYFEDFAYAAIGVGLHFTDSVGCVTSGKVENNEICMSEAFRSGVPRELIDGGAIYIWTQNKDVSISRNYIHDIDGPHGNRGIFADDGAVNVEISGNLLLNIAGGRGIDLRRAFRVQRKKGSVIRKVNIGNRMEANIFDTRCRFFVRRKDKTSFKGENRYLPRGYNRNEVVREWKSLIR